MISKVVEGCFEATKPTVKTGLAESSLGDDNHGFVFFFYACRLREWLCCGVSQH